MNKINITPKKSLNMGVIKFGLTAIATFCSAHVLSTDWANLPSNIENGLTIQKINYYRNGEKHAELNQASIQQYALEGNVIGEISDNHFKGNTDITGFSLNITDTPLRLNRLIWAAGSHSGNVIQNSLTMSNVTEGYDLNVSGGHSYKGSAKGNSLNITNSTVDEVPGGSSRDGVADENKVNIVDSDIRVIHGGRTCFSPHGAKNNYIEISGSIASWVYDGESQGGDVSGNNVIVKANGNKKSLSRGIMGGKSTSSTKANVNNNEVIIIGSDVEKSNEIDSGVYGAFAAYGNANNNKVTIKSEGNNQAIINADVFGANNEGQNTFDGPISTANGNEVNITGAIVKGDIYIAKLAGSNTSHGKLSITGDQHYRTQVESIYGGYSLSGEASQNSLTISNSDINGDIYGGYINDGYGKQASQNSLILDNITSSGNVYGGYNEGSASHTINNVITLKNVVKIEGEVAGGMAKKDFYGTPHSRDGKFKVDNTIKSDVNSGNILNIYSHHAMVKNVKNFSAYNFYLASNTQANNNILITTGEDDIDLRKSQINIYLNEDALNLKIGESINLIKSNKAKILIDNSMKNQQVKLGVGDYVFDIDADNNTLKATLVAKNTNVYTKTALNKTVQFFHTNENKLKLDYKLNRTSTIKAQSNEDRFQLANDNDVKKVKTHPITSSYSLY